jgi:hypothetical protein
MSSLATIERLIVVDAAIAKVAGVSQVAQIARLETQLRDIWWTTWRKRARAALEAGAGATSTDAVMKAVDGEMRAWGSEIEPISGNIVERIYRLSREIAWLKATRQVRGSLQYDTGHFVFAPIKKGLSQDSAAKTIGGIVWERADPTRKGTVVLVDVDRMYRAMAASPSERGYLIGPGGTAEPIKGRLPQAKAFISEAKGKQAVHMPRMSIWDGTPSIVDGRHRTEAWRQFGNNVIPVEVHPDDAAEFAAKFGASKKAIAAASPPPAPPPSSGRSGGGGRTPKFRVATSFNVEDQAAIRALRRDVVFWTGTHYEKNVRAALRKTVDDVMIRGGQDRTRAGRSIREAIENELGHATTPSGWRGSQAAYFESLAANTATVARVNGSLTSFRRAGITRYEITNPRDERTCPVCGHMDGKVFTVSQGEAVAGAVADAKDPDEVRVAHPWLRAGALRDISPKPGPQGGADARNLAAAGFCLPPFHFRCRCTVDVSDDAMFDPGPPIDEPLYSKGKSGRENLPRARGARDKAKAPSEVAEPNHAPAFAGYPKSDVTPDGPLDIEALAEALESGDEAAVRRQLNNLVDERGMVNHDLIQDRTRKAGRGLYQVDPPDHPPDAGGFNDLTGRIGVTDETHESAVAFARKTARGQWDEAANDGEDILDMWGFKTLVHETVHSTSPIIETAPTGAALWVEEATTELAARRIIADKFGVPLALADAAGNYDEPIEILIGVVARAAQVGDDVARGMVETAAFEMRKSVKIFADSDEYVAHFVKSLPLKEAGAKGKAKAALSGKLRRDLKAQLDGFEMAE